MILIAGLVVAGLGIAGAGFAAAGGGDDSEGPIPAADLDRASAAVLAGMLVTTMAWLTPSPAAAANGGILIQKAGPAR